MDAKVIDKKKCERRISSKWYNEVLESIKSAHDYNELTKILLDINRNFDSAYISFSISIPISFVRPTVLIWSNCPHELTLRYKQSGYIDIDPIFQYAKQNSLPALWRNLDWSNPKASALMQKAQALGIHDGFCFPMHGPNGEIATTNLIFKSQLHKINQRFTYVAPYLSFITDHLAAAVYRIWTNLEIQSNDELYNSDISLTARERECLIWMAEGKTSWEISQILDLSESTVNAHLATTTSKLQASNRTHAVAKAISQQHIQPTSTVSTDAVIMHI